MKYLFALLTIIILSACTTSLAPASDIVSIKNTAMADSLTTISQTQAVGLAATVNAQGTQIASLKLETPTAVITPTFLVTMVNDETIKLAILRLVGWSETEAGFETQYNDGKLAIGYYYHKNSILDDGYWIAQKNGNEPWGIVYISKGTPPCKELQKFNLNDSQPPSQCLDSNGNSMIRWQWRGQ